EDDARISQRLVTLDASSPIAWEQEKLLWGGANVAELRRLYSHLEFNRQLDQLDQLASYASHEGSAPAASAQAPEWRPSTTAAAPAPPLVREYEAILDEAALDRVLAEARAKGRLGVSVTTTPEDAMQAQLLGLSLSVEAGRGYYVPLSHRYLGAPKQLSRAAVRDRVAPVLADPAVTKIGYDVKRASIVLTRMGAPVAGPT